MKPDDFIEYSELLDAAILKADEMECASAADSVVCFDTEADEVQDIFDSGWELALLLVAARADGTDARVYFGDDEDSNRRFFFIAKSEEEAVAKVAALKEASDEEEDEESEEDIS